MSDKNNVAITFTINKKMNDDIHKIKETSSLTKADIIRSALFEYLYPKKKTEQPNICEPTDIDNSQRDYRDDVIAGLFSIINKLMDKDEIYE